MNQIGIPPAAGEPLTSIKIEGGDKISGIAALMKINN
jgi:hypothetical protein